MSYENRLFDNILDKIISNIFWFFYPIFCLQVIAYNISFDYFNSGLIVAYATMVAFTTVVFFSNNYNFRESVSMGFLLTFVNSFYWELPLHIMAFTQVGLTSNVFPQIWRLVPVPFLLHKWWFNDQNRAIKLILYGLIFSVSICTVNSVYNIIRFEILRYTNFTIKLPWIRHIYLNMMIRFGCLFFLIKTFIDHGYLKRFDEDEERN